MDCEHHLKCQNNHQHDCGHSRKEEEDLDTHVFDCCKRISKAVNTLSFSSQPVCSVKCVCQFVPVKKVINENSETAALNLISW